MRPGKPMPQDLPWLRASSDDDVKMLKRIQGIRRKLDEAVFPGARSQPETMICNKPRDPTTRCGHVGICPQSDLPAFL